MKPANKRFLIVISIIVALALSWWAWDYFGPKPLGDKLEYIGREDYGSWLPLASSSPTGLYRYATDLKLGEMDGYFKNAKLNTIPEQDGNKWRISLFNQYQNEGFTIYFYENKYAIGDLGIKTTKNIIVVPERHYGLAKASF